MFGWCNEFFRITTNPYAKLFTKSRHGAAGGPVPLRKYQKDNIRLCRPHGILEEDRGQVIDGVVANLGKHYDAQNIIDLALMLLPLAPACWNQWLLLVSL